MKESPLKRDRRREAGGAVGVEKRVHNRWVGWREARYWWRSKERKLGVV